jgi:hypothetical protein
MSDETIIANDETIWIATASNCWQICKCGKPLARRHHCGDARGRNRLDFVPCLWCGALVSTYRRITLPRYCSKSCRGFAIAQPRRRKNVCVTCGGKVSAGHVLLCHSCYHRKQKKDKPDYIHCENCGITFSTCGRRCTDALRFCSYACYWGKAVPEKTGRGYLTNAYLTWAVRRYQKDKRTKEAGECFLLLAENVCKTFNMTNDVEDAIGEAVLICLQKADNFKRQGNAFNYFTQIVINSSKRLRRKWRDEKSKIAAFAARFPERVEVI